MDETILTGIVGVVTATVSSLVTYFTTRKKYNAEINGLRMDADKTELENYKSMLDYYKMLFDDISKKQKELMEENSALRRRVNELTQQIEQNRSLYNKQQAEIERLSNELAQRKQAQE